MYDVRWLGSISWAVYVFMYFDMFYIQWHCLAKKDLWNKVFIIIIIIVIVIIIIIDRLCGLVVRVLGYRSGDPGSIPGTTK
jgi:hypothetical protein